MWFPRCGFRTMETEKHDVYIADLTFGGSGLDYINSDTTITVSNR